MLRNPALYILLIAALVGLGCPTNPEGPVFEPPGVELLYDSNYNSIQLQGDFMPGDGWNENEPLHEMTLIADFKWEIIASVSEADLNEIPPAVELKFTHDNTWEGPQNFGDSGESGLAAYDKEKGNIRIQISEGQGFYTFGFNDETLRYSTAPRLATGGIEGNILLEGDEPTTPLEVVLWAANSDGADLAELWAGDVVSGAYSFPALADSFYNLRINAGGYAGISMSAAVASGVVTQIRDITLSQVFGAISGTVGYSDAPDVLPVATVTATDTLSGAEVGLVTTDALGFYIIEGLSEGTYDLHFVAPGYSAGDLEDITVSSEGEVPGNDITLEPTPAAIPDPPYFAATIDGALDDGWAANLSDPAGDSDWGPNDYTGLHVAWDSENLYVAVTGTFETGTNTVNIYVDKDFDAGTGVTDMTTIGGGPAGDHLRKTIDMSGVSGYGADFAGSVWGQTNDPEVSDLTEPGAVTPLPGSLLAGTTATVEFSVPWLSLYPDLGGGVPPLATLGIYCVMGGGGDQHLANDTLPEVADVTAPDAVFTIQVDTDGE